MARLRSAPSTQQPAPTKTSTRQALKEKTNTARTGAAPASERDDFVKDARPTRGRPKKAAQNEDELVMAGGLGPRSDAPTSDAPMTTDELATSDGPPPPTAKANRRPPRQARKPAQNEAQSKVFEDMKKRMRATAQKEAAVDQSVDAPASSGPAGPSSDALPTKPPACGSDAKVVERSEFSISPSPPPPGKLSAVKSKRSSIAKPDSVLKSQSTPAAETSVLALKNFKRRPRQPSMLAMVQQRAARPSASHVQPATEIERENPSVYDMDAEDEDEDEEDFAPEAEGTPLHLRKAKRTSTISKATASPTATKKAAAKGTVGTRKRKSEQADISSGSLSALRAKRQKSMMPAEPSPHNAITNADHPSSPERQQTPHAQQTSEVQVINSSPSSAPLTEPSSATHRRALPDKEVIIPSTEEQAQQARGRRAPLNEEDDDAPPNETMADPLSSSPPPENPKATQTTDIMAEPLTQITPPRPKPAQAKAQKKTQRMMTSTLQSLLPRRRQVLQPRRRKSEYDIDSESDEEEGEESADDDSGSRRRTNTSAAQSRGSTARTRATKAGQKSAAPTQGTRKSTAPAGRKKSAVASKKAPAKSTRTYGRTAASDKENDATDSDFEELSDNDDSALPDTSLTVHEVSKQSDELAAAKAKFAEVDGWDMEFESVSFDEGRSSSQTWR